MRMSHRTENRLTSHLTKKSTMKIVINYKGIPIECHPIEGEFSILIPGGEVERFDEFSAVRRAVREYWYGHYPMSRKPPSRAMLPGECEEALKNAREEDWPGFQSAARMSALPVAELTEAFARQCDYAAEAFEKAGQEWDAEDCRERAKFVRSEEAGDCPVHWANKRPKKPAIAEREYRFSCVRMALHAKEMSNLYSQEGNDQKARESSELAVTAAEVSRDSFAIRMVGASREPALMPATVVPADTRRRKARRPNLSLAQIGLKKGDELTYRRDGSLKAVVADPDKNLVVFEGKVMKIGRALKIAAEQEGVSWLTSYSHGWRFKGKLLLHIINEKYREMGL